MVNVLVHTYTYNGWLHKDVALWAVRNKVETVFEVKAGYPITVLRNQSCKEAIRLGFDYLLMIDNDMVPDSEIGTDKRAKVFLPNAIEFAEANKPCIVGAPYCTGGDKQECNVFKYESTADQSATMPANVVRFSRKEASERTGFEAVPAIGTGMLLISVAALAKIEKPYFKYEYTNDDQTQLLMTEDIYFTRNASWSGVGVYTFWDGWAGHRKELTVKRPKEVDVSQFSKTVRQHWQLED